MAAKRLPNADISIVEPAKLTNYLLSSTHPTGKGKAKLFSSFGFTLGQVEVLRAALLEHARKRPVVETTRSSHGTKYVLECAVTAPDGRDPCIRSVWIVDAGQVAPRLVTAFPA